jgi:hypothetical protein
MNTAMKKLILALITTLLGVLSSGAMAQTNLGVTVPGYGVYDFSNVTGTFTQNSALLQSQPWWNSSSAAYDFAAAGGFFNPYPDFAYSVSGGRYVSFYNADGSRAVPGDGSIDVDYGYGFAVATVSSAGVPEIDGALAPQVGFLLACLFLIFGRKKENTESLMTA